MRLKAQITFLIFEDKNLNKNQSGLIDLFNYCLLLKQKRADLKSL